MWRYTADDGVVIGEKPPLQILFRVLGWRIRNPSTGEMKLAVGSGVPVRRLALDSFQVAANLADELVNRAASGNEPRYHGADVVSDDDDPKATLDALCAVCCGRFRDTSDKLSLVIMHNCVERRIGCNAAPGSGVIGVGKGLVSSPAQDYPFARCQAARSESWYRTYRGFKGPSANTRSTQFHSRCRHIDMLHLHRT